MAVRLVVRRVGSSGNPSDASYEAHYEFEQPRLVIGRGASADLRLPALSVSEVHATLERTERGYSLTDAGSTNGTLVNGASLVPARPRSLHDGDTLRVGEFEVSFQTGGPVTGLTSPERTISLAKRLLAEASGAEREGPSLRWSVGGEPRETRKLPPPPVRWLVGRDPEADLHVETPDVSRRQLELEITLDGMRARDLEAKNAMLVNGMPMRERLLRDGDRLQVGSLEITLDDPAERALKALDRQADIAYVATEPLHAAPTDEEAQNDHAPDGSNEGAAAARDELTGAATAATAARTSLGPDALIYALAMGVLAASAAGLVWLLSN